MVFMVIDDIIMPSFFTDSNSDIVDHDFDEESLASIINKEGIEWCNYFRQVERNYLFLEPVRPTQFGIDYLVYSSFLQIFPHELIDHLVY